MDECGIKINTEQHKKIKEYFVSHANAQAEDLLREIANLQSALAKRHKK
jgi:hypothetical protein